MAQSKANFKVWRATKASQAGMMVTPDSTFMIANQSNFLAVTQQGTIIAGPVSFAITSEQIRYGGFFAGMPDFARMIPSTIVTPLPAQIPIPPVAFIASIGRSLPVLLALLAV